MSDTYDPPKGDIPILHADTDLLVVDKPAGLLSVPGKGEALCALFGSALRSLVTVVGAMDEST